MFPNNEVIANKCLDGFGRIVTQSIYEKGSIDFIFKLGNWDIPNKLNKK